MPVNFDPILFNKSHWQNNNAASAEFFKTFCISYITQLKHYPELIVQSELDDFIFLLHERDWRSIEQVNALVERLRLEQ